MRLVTIQLVVVTKDNLVVVTKDMTMISDNITQLYYLNSESREETDQKIFVAKTNIYSFRQLCLE